MLNEADIAALFVTLRLASFTTLILLVLGTTAGLVAVAQPVAVQVPGGGVGGAAPGAAADCARLLSAGCSRSSGAGRPHDGSARRAFARLHLHRSGGGFGHLFVALCRSAFAGTPSSASVAAPWRSPRPLGASPFDRFFSVAVPLGPAWFSGPLQCWGLPTLSVSSVWC